MNIYLAHCDEVPDRYSNIPAVSGQLAAQRDQTRHREVADPFEADVVLFVEPHLVQRDWRLRSFVQCPLGRRFVDKLAVYDERDLPWCRLPGIYVSMPRSGFLPRWQVPGSYWHVQPLRQRLPEPQATVNPDLLFSFVGSQTHPCRKDVMALRSRRAHIEAVEDFVFWDARSPQFERKRTHFAQVTLRSKFVLCPRGHGTASIRLFEVLSAGRVPVIIADDWVPPAGPEWGRFALRWPSSAIAELPGALERMEDRAATMGARAQTAFAEWFAPDVVITKQLDQLEQLLARPRAKGFPPHGYRNLDFLRAQVRHARARLRERAPK